MDAEPLRRRVVHDLLPALGIMLAAWLLMSLMQGMPTLCALARPCPAEDVRVAPALTFGR